MSKRQAYLSLQRLPGLIFMGTGAFKLFGSLGHGLPTGAPGFAVLLAAIGVPWPLLAAYGVCLLELGGGLLLCLGVGVRGVAALLACDMAVALLTVGLPGLGAHPVRLAGQAVGQEPWRVPLELALWVAMGAIALRRASR